MANCCNYLDLDPAYNNAFGQPLMRSNTTWSQATLNEFIADPQKRVPDNRMPYAGLPDNANHTDLLAYLLTVMK